MDLHDLPLAVVAAKDGAPAQIDLAPAAASALAVAGTASADGRAEHVSGTLGPTTFTLSGICSFPLTVTFSGEYHDIVTPSGKYVGVTIRTVTLSANGRSVSGTSPHIILSEGSGRTVVGLPFRFVVPGVGALSINAGRVVLDETGGILFEAGQTGLLHGDAPELCAYLAGT
jgi:hypothetical protein